MSHITTARSHPLRRVVGVALVAVISLAACGGDDDDAAALSADTAAVSALPAPGVVAPDEAAALAARPEVTVVDVRTPGEYDEGHLEGALLVDLSGDDFAGSIGELDRDGEYLVYCRSGNRSAQAVQIMRDLGFEQVWDLSGGIAAWEGAGQPVTTG